MSPAIDFWQISGLQLRYCLLCWDAARLPLDNVSAMHEIICENWP